MSPPATGSSLPDLGGEGIGGMISVGAQGKGAAADASGLLCPICNEEMVTLLQLNRHIDDNHQELAEEEQDEVKTWFDKQVLKAKRFQPLSLINQKLRGLDVFETNESTPMPSHRPTPSTSSITGPAGKAPADTPIDPDEMITRKHWQRTTNDDYCTDPTCRRSLGPIVGSINCRHCGKLFCEEHTMYQMKLSRSANHEPVRGYWARVCETCYKSREGYNDHTGHVVDHTTAFVEMRRKRVERHNLEVSRLEKRLTKLTRLLANPPEKLPGSNGSILSPMASLAGQKNARKIIEQSVVTWEDDNEVIKCPFCQQDFGSWTFRRHHCRICGRVVCADPQTGCSSEIGLNVASQTHLATEKPSSGTTPAGQVSVDIRMCRDCSHTIFASREFASSLLQKPPDQRAYETLRQFERGILQLLPSFHRALIALQPEAEDKFRGGVVDRPPPTHAQIQEAAKMRKRLVDAFAKYGAAAKRMRDLPTTDNQPGQKRLQTAVYTYASGFLHTNMLPLKSLPQLLRSSSSSSSRSLARPNSMNGTNGHLPHSNLRHAEFVSNTDASSHTTKHLYNGGTHHHPPPPPSDTDDGASTVVSQLETEEKELRERLNILEEQLFMVDQMAQAATKARRFEEVSALSRNKQELEGEIEVLRSRVGDVEMKWEGVYQNGNGAA